MDATTFEEKLSGELDALYDGALLLAPHAERAEAFVVDVVRSAAGRPSPEAPAFRPWILRRLVRHVLDELEEVPPEESPAPPAAGEGIEVSELDHLLRDLARLEAAEGARLGDLLRACMRELPLRDRAALWLVTVMGLDYGEAGAALRTGREEVRDRLYRARRELQGRVALALREVSESGSGPGSRLDHGRAADGGRPPRAREGGG